MKPSAVQEVMVVVIDETVANSKKLIEALLFWTIVTMRTKVPLAIQCRTIACSLQSLSQSHFLQGHIDPLGSVHVSLSPMMHTTALRVTPRQQRCPGRTAYCVCIRLK